MTKVNKVYGFILPISAEEYSKGNKYVSITNAVEDKTNGVHVELLERTEEHHDHLGKVKKTVKKMHVHNKVPYMIRKLVPSNACVIRETSFTSSDKIRTTYLNEHFCDSVFNITIDTSLDSNPFEEDVLYHDISTKFVSSTDKSTICFKKVTVEVNQYFLGWVAHEIDKSLGKVLVNHHEKIVTKRDEWVKLDAQELDDLEASSFGFGP